MRDARKRGASQQRGSVRKIGEDARRSLSESINTTSKAVAALAGLGVFFFATGYFVEWQRLSRVDLPAEEILPLIANEQIAAAGVRELIVSIAFGVVTVTVFSLGFVYLGRATREREGWVWARLDRLCGRKKEIALPTIVVGIAAVLIVPFTRAGLLVAAALTGLAWYGLVLVHRHLDGARGAKFPIWRLCLATAVAVALLSGVRQRAFPQPRPLVRIKFEDEAKAGPPIAASYIASDSDKVLLGVPFGRDEEEERLLVLDRDELLQVWLEPGRRLLPETPSLLEHGIGLIAPDFHFSCIPPECRTGENDQFGPSLLF